MRKGKSKHNTNYAFRKGKHLFISAFLILLFQSVILTLSPAVKYRSLQADLKWGHWFAFVTWFLSSLLVSRELFKKLPAANTILFHTTQLLIGWGTLTIWRLNPIFGFRQTIWLIICSILGLFIIRNAPLISKTRKYKYLWLFFGFFLVALTLLFGTYPGGVGPNLWLGGAGVYFQPSEMLKLIIIIFLASFFSENPIIKKNYLEIIFTTAVLVIAALSLLIFQRDFGTAIIFAGIYIVMLFFAIKKKRVLVYSSLLLLALVLVGYNFIDLIRIRFQGWIMPWANAQTTSYQIIQSLMSIAAGGLFGTGLGMGYPNLVPLSHSDFVFSAIVEESGLLGGVALIILLLMFFYQGVKIAISSRDRFFQFLAAGITVLFSIQSILIIGGNIRLLPITGVTLPFLSYGGSSLLVSSIGTYLLMVFSDKAPLDDDLYQSKTPYKLISAIISLSYVALALTIGWWGIYRAQDLQTRPDNARTLISNIFVKRGTIFSRNNRILAESTGSPGFFLREYAYPPLSNTVGYISQKYGLFGLEESNDDFLRGIKGYPSSDIWLNFLLYDQPPEGRPIRLTIDQKTQERADQLLNGTKGAVMVLNPDTGEILAASTFPYFDANNLEEYTGLEKIDENNLFINRVSQSAYPIGGLLAPFFLNEDNDFDNVDVSNFSFLDIFSDENCGIGVSEENETFPLIQNGCQSVVYLYARDRSPNELKENPLTSTLFQTANVGLPVSLQVDVPRDVSWYDILLGSQPIRSNPYQIARLYSILSTGDKITSPFITSAVNTESGGWVVLPKELPKSYTGEFNSDYISNILAMENNPGWEISAITRDENGFYSWHITGTISSWTGNPALVVSVIEDNNREFVKYIGNQLFEAVVFDQDN